ncbi:MAG: T9SS type A sorting domain-containing protein [Chlorobi bacterium]|nr:T9SS type A sorting domain-containing protein [Chlorobiota bacterium]
MKIIVLIITLFIMSIIELHSEWKMIDSLYYPYKDNQLAVFYKAIDCCNSKNCISLLFAGEINVMSRITSDGGTSWHTSLQDTLIKKYNSNKGDYDILYRPPRPFNIYYQSQNLCIALCDSGYYWRSTDTCKTWIKHKIDTDKSLINIDFYSDDLGIISTYYKLFKTIDGGLTWDRVVVNCETPPTGFHEVKMPNENTIIVLGYNIHIGDYIARSDNGGLIWENYDVIQPRVIDIEFFNESEGFAIGRPQIQPDSPYRRDVIQETSDGGKTWNLRLDTLLSPKKGLLKLEFADRMHGMAMGAFWKIWNTIDGGKTWNLDTTYNYPHTNDYFWDIAYPSPDTVYGVTSMTGKIYMKTDYTVGIEAEQNRTYTNVSLYPNPARPGETITIAIEADKPESCVASVYAADGRQVSDSFQFDLRPGRNGIQYHADTDLSPGVYFIMIEKGCGVISARFVVGE